MWTDFTSLTIGEWFGLAFGVAMVVAMFASYVLPAVFLYKLSFRLRRYRYTAVGEKERRRHWLWSIYLLIVGIGMLVFGSNDGFLFKHGVWIAVVGFFTLIIGPSFWCTIKEPREVEQRP